MTEDSPFDDTPWEYLDVPEESEYVLATYNYQDKSLTVEAGLLDGLSDGMQKELFHCFRDEGIGHLDDGTVGQQTVALPGPAWNEEEIATRMALLED